MKTPSIQPNSRGYECVRLVQFPISVTGDAPLFLAKGPDTLPKPSWFGRACLGRLHLIAVSCSKLHQKKKKTANNGWWEEIAGWREARTNATTGTDGTGSLTLRIQVNQTKSNHPRGERLKSKC
jgi:hypothetical protein